MALRVIRNATKLRVLNIDSCPRVRLYDGGRGLLMVSNREYSFYRGHFNDTSMEEKMTFDEKEEQWDRDWQRKKPKLKKLILGGTFVSIVIAFGTGMIKIPGKDKKPPSES